MREKARRCEAGAARWPNICGNRCATTGGARQARANGDGLLEELSGDYDAEHGDSGYSRTSRSSKPQPSNLVFFLDRAAFSRAGARQGDATAQPRGNARGIRDHIGGGHRYSTDRYWRVPHFEKMLYGNGQLASLYAEAFA
jgi:uncharacterized protein YyaL (SSP411 family)